ncbi:MAG: flagellar hook-associated protein FlgK [Alphaproteobacteria bacterium]
MASIYDIASSAVRSHKEALSGTSQNIANVDTDGYTRREVKLDEVSAQNSGLAAKGANVGLGVRVDQVRRAYDEVLATQLRNIGSKFQSSQAFVANLEKLENYLLPDGNLIDSINQFFSKLTAVAAEPASQANRVAAISYGAEVASSFARTTGSLDFLKSQIDQEISFTLNRVNEISEQLGKINRDIGASSSSKGASPSLLDIRDKLLLELAEITAVSVTAKDTGEVKVDLGFDAVGATLVDGNIIGNLSYKITDDNLQFFIGQSQPLTGFDSGVLRGISDSFFVLNKTENELDGLARRFVSELNHQHMQGLDLNGEHGEPLFSSSQHQLAAIDFDKSEIIVDFKKNSGRSDIYGDILVSFDGGSGQWIATHNGQSLAKGREKLDFDGFSISASGPAKDGDSFMLARTKGDASNLEFLLADPRSLAATAKLIIDASANNLGTAVAKVAGGEVSNKPLNNTLEMFQNNLSPISSKSFLRGGLIGSIPAGLDEVLISSNANQSSISFSAKNFEKISRIEMSLDDQAYTLNIPTGAQNLNIETASDVAKYFNSGLLRFQNNAGKTFDSKALGAVAIGSEAALQFSSSNKTFSSGSALIDGNSHAGQIVSPIGASDIYVFTREGRQIAGKALSAVDANMLITQENGFTEYASYRTEFLNGTLDRGYRGLEAQTILASSGNSLTFGVLGGATGIGSGPLINSQSSPINSYDEEKLTIASADLGISETVTIPANASAKTIASLLNEGVEAKGIRFEAQNKVQIQIDSTSGNPISFGLAGDNSEPVLIKAQYNAALGLPELAKAVNAMSVTTGITAEVSANGKRIVLTEANGGDIRVSNIINADISIRALDGNYSELGNALTLNPRDEVGLVISGMLTARADAAVSISSSQGVSLNSSTNHYLNSSVAKSFLNAGDTAIFQILDVPGVDATSDEGSGSHLYHGNHTVNLSLNKADGTVDTVTKHSSALTMGSGSEMAAELVAAMRSSATLPKIESSFFANLPPEGSQMKISYAGEEYSLVYRNNKLDVVGLDSDQFYADLQHSNAGYRIVVSLPEGSNSGSRFTPVIGSGEGQFGFSNWVNYLTGNVPEPMNVNETRALTIKTTDSSQVTVTLRRLGDGTYDVSSSDASISAVFENGNLTSNELTKITLKNTTINAVLALNGSLVATQMGFDLSREEIFQDENKIIFRSLDGKPSDAKIQSQRDQNNNLLRLSNLPNEELILLVSSDGAKKISMTHSEKLFDEKPMDSQRIDLKLVDAESRVMGIFDGTTGQLIGERRLNQGQTINFQEFSVALSGQMKEGDSFSISTNDDLVLNGANLDSLAQLGTSSESRLSYQDSYRNYLVDVGSKLSANRVELESVTAQFDAVKESFDEKSGVNLDAEAANLIQQQQSYQAAARLLQTARDMFDTILKI